MSDFKDETINRNNLAIVENYNLPRIVQIINLEDEESDEQSTTGNNSVRILVKQHKKIGKNKQNLLKKQFNIQFTPTYHTINEIETLFLVGEVFIIFDFDNKYFDKTHISCLNNFKRIHETIIHKNNRFLEVKLEYKVPTIKYFYHSAQKLMNQPDQNIHDLGVLLQLYQEFCFECYETLKLIECTFNTHEEQQQLRKEFEEQKQKYLDNFTQDEFTYVLHLGNNIVTKEFEMESMYISEPFLLLMGTNLEQYERYLHRFGLNEFVDSKSSLIFNIFQLKQMLKSFGKQTDENPILKGFNDNDKIDVTLYTFDGIQIQAKVQCLTVLPYEGMQKCDNVNLYPNMLMEIKYDIEPTSLQQLLSIRQNQQNNQLQVYDKAYMNDIDFSLDYSLQSEIFYEMAKLHNIYSKSKSRTSFRYLTKKEQANLKQYNVAYPDAKF